MGTPRRAGVSALGVGGTNAHVILEEAPPRRPGATLGRPALVPVSARDTEALGELTGLLRTHLRAAPDTSPADVAATLGCGRPHHAVRSVVVGGDAAELARALEQLPAPPLPFGPPVFAFPGQGSARGGMARGIHAGFAEARAVLDRCERVYAEEFGGTLLPLLLGENGDADQVWPTEVAQPALFAHQAALLAVWRACGVHPAVLLGHSVGEYAALHAAGALTVDDGLRLTARRGRLMHRDGKPGGMLAVRTDLATARRTAATSGADVAAVNGPRSQVLSGTPTALAEAVRLLDRDGIQWRALPVDRAFHSAELDAALAAFRAAADEVTYAPLRVPFVSGLDGEVRPVGWLVDAQYLCAQARRPVRFDLAVASAAQRDRGGFVELGAGETLTGLGKHCLPESRWLSGQGAGDELTGQQRGLLHSLGELYRAGADLDWAALADGGGRISLPGYPLRRRAMAPPGKTPVPPTAVAQPANADPMEMPKETPMEIPRQTPLLSSDTEPLLGVRELTAQKLGVEVAEITPDRSFFELGADSLSLMGMATELERRYGVRVPVRDFFDAADTPRKLADRLAQLHTEPKAATAQPVPPQSTTAQPMPSPPPPRTPHRRYATSSPSSWNSPGTWSTRSPASSTGSWMPSPPQRHRRLPHPRRPPRRSFPPRRSYAPRLSHPPYPPCPGPLRRTGRRSPHP